MFWTSGLACDVSVSEGKAKLRHRENAGVSALCRTRLYVGTAILRETRQEKPSASLVLHKRFTEIGRQEDFFFAGFSIKTEQE